MPSLWAMLGLNNSAFLAKLDQSKKDAAAAGHEIASSLGEAVTEKLAQVASVAFIEEAIKGTIEWGEQVSILAERMGITTKAEQQWDYALKLNGSTIQAATTFFERMGMARKKALDGQDEEIKAFRDLGVSIDDLKGKRLEDIGSQIASAFEAGDPQALISSLRQVGGKGAGELVAAFREGFAELIAEAPTVGDAVVDSLRDAADRSKSVWMEFRAGIAPLVSDLAELTQGLWRGLNTAMRGTVGFFTGGIKGSNDLVKEYEESLDEADRQSAERNKKRHDPLPPGLSGDAAESKAAARDEKRAAEDKLRLEERLYDLRQKSALDDLTKEQQILELSKRRVELATWIAANWGRLSEAGRLQGQIDIETMMAEQNRIERGTKADKDKKESAPARDVNQLQRIGAFVGDRNQELNIHRENGRRLVSIDQGVKALKPTGGGVGYG